MVLLIPISCAVGIWILLRARPEITLKEAARALADVARAAADLVRGSVRGSKGRWVVILPSTSGTQVAPRRLGPPHDVGPLPQPHATVQLDSRGGEFWILTAEAIRALTNRADHLPNLWHSNEVQLDIRPKVVDTGPVQFGQSRKVCDHRDDVVSPISLKPSEVDELPCPTQHSSPFWRTGYRHAASTAKLEQTLVAE